MSETKKYRHLTRPYCYKADGEPGCGIDLASGGDPVVPWAWQLDLPPDQYDYYNAGNKPRGPLNLFGDAFRKFVEAESLDFVYASHLLEDVEWERWPEVFRVWAHALKRGGNLIILVPERDLWAKAIKAGQTPNCSHRYEPFLGDMSTVATSIGLKVIHEDLTAVSPDDYTIMGVFRKI